MEIRRHQIQRPRHSKPRFHRKLLLNIANNPNRRVPIFPRSNPRFGSGLLETIRHIRLSLILQQPLKQPISFPKTLHLTKQSIRRHLLPKPAIKIKTRLALHHSLLLITHQRTRPTLPQVLILRFPFRVQRTEILEIRLSHLENSTRQQLFFLLLLKCIREESYQLSERYIQNQLPRLSR